MLELAPAPATLINAYAIGSSPRTPSAMANQQSHVSEKREWDLAPRTPRIDQRHARHENDQRKGQGVAAGVRSDDVALTQNATELVTDDDDAEDVALQADDVDRRQAEQQRTISRPKLHEQRPPTIG
jgi:hypothetical protein